MVNRTTIEQLINSNESTIESNNHEDVVTLISKIYFEGRMKWE